MRLLQQLPLPRRQRRPPRLQIKLQEGRPQVDDMGAWYAYWRDPYHLLLTVPWVGFLLLILLTYVVINALFALVYLLGGEGVANAQPGSFLDHFFFSVQTLATIGYGFMYPKTLFANLVMTLEVMVGIVATHFKWELAPDLEKEFINADHDEHQASPFLSKFP